jgi:hypothetical protein
MRTTVAGMLLLAIALAGCGGDSTGPEITIPTPINGSMSARIDGTNWSAVGLTAIASAGSPTIISIGATNTQFTLGMAWVDSGPRTYTVGQSIGLNATLTSGSSAWNAAATLGSGSITVTTRTAERVAGTFTFTMVPAGAGVTGTRSVTNGVFDIRF